MIARRTEPMRDAAVVEIGPMIEVRNAVQTRRPIGEVFAVVADWRHAPQWVAGLLETEITSPDAIGAGATFRDLGKFLGRWMETTWEVVEFRPDEAFTVRTLTSPVPARVSHLFEPDGNGTRLTLTSTLEPGGFFSLAGPLVARGTRRQLGANLQNLKDLLESGTSAEPAS